MRKKVIACSITTLISISVFLTSCGKEAIETGFDYTIIEQSNQDEDTLDTFAQINQSNGATDYTTGLSNGEKDEQGRQDDNISDSVVELDINGYNANLPDNIIFNVDGKEVIIERQSAEDIINDLGLDMGKVVEYGGGAKTSFSYLGTGIASSISLDEKLTSKDSDELILCQIILECASSCERDVSLLGISNTSTLEDWLNILGTPESYGKSGYSTKYYYYSWKNLSIGEYIIDLYITSKYAKGPFNEIMLDFK